MQRTESTTVSFIDLTEIFNLVSREGLFKALKKIGCPPTLLSIMELFHTCMKGIIKFDGASSEEFEIKSDAKQGLERYPRIAQMASAISMRATFISHKLKFLKDQGDQLISAVGDYVNRITAAGDSWTQGGDNNMDYQELCQKIDTAVEFLCKKCEELSGASVGAAANQLSGEQQNMASQSIAAASSTPATSDRQPAAPLASTATRSYRQPAAPLASTATRSYRQAAAPQASTARSSRQAATPLASLATRSYRQPSARLGSTATKPYRQSTESVQPADETQLKPVLDRIAVIEEAMCSFRSRAEKIAEQQSGIDQQLKELLSKLSEKLVHIPNLLESVKENVDALDARIDGIIDICRNKYKDLETEMGDLAAKFMANTQRVEVLSEGQVQKTTLLRELETRLQTLEADGGRNVKDAQKQAEKGEANLSKLIQEVAAMSPRLQQLEMKSPRTRCGFHAWTVFTEEVAAYTIRQYKTTCCNVGKNFNADSGIFTAPVDGLYVASISLRLSENENMCVGVEYKPTVDQMLPIVVCQSTAEMKETTACDVGVVDMKAGEVLFSRVYDIEKNTNHSVVSFSCFLLG